jgi:soluble lytic murein transglycosylase
MEAISKTSSTKKQSFKRFAFLFLVSLQAIFIEACQVPTTVEPQSHYSVDDAIRSSHASRILDGSGKITAEFNGDAKFRRYISSYIQSQNDTIDSEKLTNSLISISRRNGMDPVFLLAVIKTESKFNQNAIGSVGEVGLMQIRPETAEWICNKFNIKWKGREALKDPSYNVLVGSFYMLYLKNTLNKSKPVRYITAYNTGLKTLKHMSPEKFKESDYFNRVVTNYIGIYASLKQIKVQTTGANSAVATAEPTSLVHFN